VGLLSLAGPPQPFTRHMVDSNGTYRGNGQDNKLPHQQARSMPVHEFLKWMGTLGTRRLWANASENREAVTGRSNRKEEADDSQDDVERIGWLTSHSISIAMSEPPAVPAQAASACPTSVPTAARTCSTEMAAIAWVSVFRSSHRGRMSGGGSTVM